MIPLPPFIIEQQNSLLVPQSIFWLIAWILLAATFLTLMIWLFITENYKAALHPKNLCSNSFLAIASILAGSVCLFVCLDNLYNLITQTPILILTTEGITKPSGLLSRMTTIPWNEIVSITVKKGNSRKGTYDDGDIYIKGLPLCYSPSKLMRISSDTLPCTAIELRDFLWQILDEFRSAAYKKLSLKTPLF